MKRFLQTGYLLPLAAVVAGFVTAAGGIVDQTWLRWTAAGLGLLVGAAGVVAKFLSDQRAERQRSVRRRAALRAALEQLLEASGWLPDYFPPDVRLNAIEQRVRVGSDVRRDVEVETTASWSDVGVDAEGRDRSPGASRETTGDDDQPQRIASLMEVAAEHAEVVVLGDPGTGKSWLVRNHARELTRQQLDRLPPAAANIPDGIVVPVLVRADELTRTVHDTDGDVWAALAAVVAARARNHSPPDAARELQQWLREAFTPTSDQAPLQTVVLVDAFDERPAVPPGQPDRLRDALNALARAPHARLVLSSRIVGYHSPFDHGVEHTTVQVLPFDLHQIERFVDAWYHDAAPTAEQLKAQLRLPHLRGFAAVPLLLSFLCLLGPQRVVGRRATLYREVLDRLLRRPWEPRTPHHLDQEIMASRRMLLGVIADAMSRGRWRDRIAEEELLAVIGRHCREHSAWTTQLRTPGAELQQLGSVLIPSGTAGDRWLWVHRTLHEFCLADHLARQGADAAVDTLRAHFWYDADWYETIALTGGLLADTDDGRAQVVRLLDAICNQPDDVFYAMLLLAATVLAETPDPTAHDHRRILERLRPLLTSPVDVDFRRGLAVAVRIGPPALDPYRELSDAVPFQRRLTVAKAAAPVSRDAHDYLSALAGSAANSWVRAEAANALGQVDQSEGLKVLGGMARTDDDPWLRSEAVRALGRMGPAAVETLDVVARTDDDPRVRAEAARALGQLGERRAAAQVLGEVARDADDLVEGLVAVGALTQLGPEAVEALIEVARSAEVGLVRHEAARALAPLGERRVAVEVLSELALTDGSGFRHEAAEDLAQLGRTPMALAVLSEVARSYGDPQVRREAAQALRRLGAVAVETLRDVARTGEDLSVRQEAAQALAEQGERQLAVQVLTEVAHTADLGADAAQTRVEVAETLGQLGEHEVAVTTLTEVAHASRYPWVRSRAAAALERLGERGVAVDVLSELARTSDDSSLRWRAAKALAELGERQAAIDVLVEVARTRQEAAQALADLGERRLAVEALAARARSAGSSSTRWEGAKALEDLAKHASTLVMDTLEAYPADDLTAELYTVAARIAPSVRQADADRWDGRRARLQTFARWSERQLTAAADGR
ncbi:MAG TPA: HEAT repeat domain-containing protein [Nitriliruptorales bacterium]|nr:HEAT repeat domain-containing protein [Nitriliruptorales bacterium]